MWERRAGVQEAAGTDLPGVEVLGTQQGLRESPEAGFAWAARLSCWSVLGLVTTSESGHTGTASACHFHPP